MSFKFGFKGIDGIRLSDVSREVISEDGIGKGPAAR